MSKKVRKNKAENKKTADEWFIKNGPEMARIIADVSQMYK